jgi:hypothetical protein
MPDGPLRKAKPGADLFETGFDADQVVESWRDRDASIGGEKNPTYSRNVAVSLA